MKKLLLMMSIISFWCLCFAEGKSNDVGGIDATFKVKYAGVTITIYNVDSNIPKACSTNEFDEFTCNLELYYDGDKLNVSFGPEKALYEIS